MKKNIFVLNASGNSMEPLIKSGARILASFENIHVSIGDVVIFSTHKKLCAHRVIKINHKHKIKWFLMKGDNNTFYDGWIPQPDVLGRVEKICYETHEINLNSSMNKLLKYIFTLFSILVSTFHLAKELKKLGKISILRSAYRGLLMR